MRINIAIDTWIACQISQYIVYLTNYQRWYILAIDFLCTLTFLTHCGPAPALFFFFFHFIFFKSGALSLPSTLINLWVVIWTRNSDIFNPLPSPFSSLVIPLSLILSALRFQKLPVHIDGRTFSDSSHSLSGTS